MALVDLGFDQKQSWTGELGEEVGDVRSIGRSLNCQINRHQPRPDGFGRAGHQHWEFGAWRTWSHRASGFSSDIHWIRMAAKVSLLVM